MNRVSGAGCHRIIEQVTPKWARFQRDRVFEVAGPHSTRPDMTFG